MKTRYDVISTEESRNCGIGQYPHSQSDGSNVETVQGRNATIPQAESITLQSIVSVTKLLFKGLFKVFEPRKPNVHMPCL